MRPDWPSHTGQVKHLLSGSVWFWHVAAKDTFHFIVRSPLRRHWQCEDPGDHFTNVVKSS